MFYDRSASDGRPFSIVRIMMSVTTALLVPPFIALAIAPMLLMLLPVAFVVIPFMIPAFFPGAHSTEFEFQRVPSWRPAFAMQLGQVGQR